MHDCADEASTLGLPTTLFARDWDASRSREIAIKKAAAGVRISRHFTSYDATTLDFGRHNNVKIHPFRAHLSLLLRFMGSHTTENGIVRFTGQPRAGTPGLATIQGQKQAPLCNYPSRASSALFGGIWWCTVSFSVSVLERPAANST